MEIRVTRLAGATCAFGMVCALWSSQALAEPVAYTLDPSHSQIVFSYDHLGFSTTYGMFSGFTGEVVFDASAPETSRVEVSFPVRSMLTGWQERFDQFMGPQFFGEAADSLVQFSSTGIEVTGETTALISGDLVLNGETVGVTLDARLNKLGRSPLTGQDWAGFDATTTLKRSDFGLGDYVPFIGDEVTVWISIEAAKVED